jgi:WD40 repeat protein
MVRSDGASSPGGQGSDRKLPPGVTLKRVLSGHTAEIRCLAIDRNGEKLASGSDDFTVRAWDVATGRQICALTP